MLNAFISLPLPNPYMMMNKGYCSWGVVESVLLLSVKAGLKPVQPMRMYWALRLRGPRPMMVGQLFIFARYSLRTTII